MTVVPRQSSGGDRPKRPDTVAYWAILLGGAIHKGTQRVLNPFKMTPTEFLILHMCHRGEANTVTDLARVSPLEISAMSRQVERLRSRGLLERRRSKRDRRVVHLELTEEGRLLMPELYRTVMVIEDKTVHGMTPEEREYLMKALRKVTIDLEDSQRLLDP